MYFTYQESEKGKSASIRAVLRILEESAIYKKSDREKARVSARFYQFSRKLERAIYKEKQENPRAKREKSMSEDPRGSTDPRRSREF